MSAKVVIAPQMPQLTVRQMTLLGYLADGLSPGQIGRRFGISSRSVTAARWRLRVALGASSDPQAVHRAYELGLLRVAVARPVAGDWPAGQVGAVSGGVLTPKPRATPADARAIAARLEASFRGGPR